MLVEPSLTRHHPTDLAFSTNLSTSIDDLCPSTSTPEATSTGPVSLDPEGRPIRQVAYVETKTGPITVAAVGPRDLVLVTVSQTKPLIGPSAKEESRQNLTAPVVGEITALALDARGEDLFVGTSSGQLIQFDLRDPNAPKLGRSVEATGPSHAKITALSFLSGDRTLIVGDAGGGVSAWRLIDRACGHGFFCFFRRSPLTSAPCAPGKFDPAPCQPSGLPRGLAHDRPHRAWVLAGDPSFDRTARCLETTC
jgi:ABC-type uncharacterized transport system permease subunit